MGKRMKDGEKLTCGVSEAPAIQMFFASAAGRMRCSAFGCTNDRSPSTPRVTPCPLSLVNGPGTRVSTNAVENTTHIAQRGRANGSAHAPPPAPRHARGHSVARVPVARADVERPQDGGGGRLVGPIHRRRQSVRAVVHQSRSFAVGAHNLDADDGAKRFGAHHIHCKDREGRMVY